MDLSFYVFAGVGLFGFLLIFVTFLLGELGHMGDFDHADVDVGHDLHVGDADVHAGGDHAGDTGDGEGPGWLSARVISIFLTAFGTVGAAARYSGLHVLTSSVLGLGAGYALGWLTWRAMRWLWAQQGSSEIHLSQLQDGIGEVTVAIPGSGPGQVACVVDGKRTYQIARSGTGAEIPLGATVRIAAVAAEGVVVTPVSEAPGSVSEELRRRL